MNPPPANAVPGWRAAAVGGLAAVAAAGLALAPPIRQDPAYHLFADGRPIAGIPNGLNVLSNAPFAVVGALGIVAALRRGAEGAGRPFAAAGERWPWLVAFAGVGLTAAGSAYYHLAPGNERLVWDRLPMTVAFGALLCAVIAERVSTRAGLGLLGPMVVAGIASVAWWDRGERVGAGDLRPYVLLQFYPIVAIPLMLVLFPARHTGARAIAWAVGWYGVAKALEVLDRAIYSVGGVVSGHTLKHLAAAGATWCLCDMIRRRRALSPGEPAG